MFLLRKVRQQLGKGCGAGVLPGSNKRQRNELLRVRGGARRKPIFLSFCAEEGRDQAMTVKTGIEALGYQVDWTGKQRTETDEAASDSRESLKAKVEAAALVVIFASSKYGRGQNITAGSREELREILVQHKDFVLIKLTDELKTHTSLDDFDKFESWTPTTPDDVMRTLVTALVHERYTKLVHKQRANATTAFYENRDRYMGEMENGVKCGTGQLYMANGHKYDGEFLHDKMHGYGELSLGDKGTYSGDFKNGQFDGRGELKYGNGDKYVGDFKSGKCHGQGVLRMRNGDVYEGDFQEDFFHGTGVYRTKNGDVYEGSFAKNEMCGQGSLRVSNGDVYIGEWKAHKFHGKGEYTLANGDRYIGEFKRGYKDGFGQIIYANGNWFKGSFVKDMRHGSGAAYDCETQMIDSGMWHIDKRIE